MVSQSRQIDILTLFPGVFGDYCNESIIKRARESGLIKLAIHNIRDWAVDKHRSVDDKPYGGGAGMVMMVNILHAAIKAVRSPEARVILLSPQGRVLDQATAKRLSKIRHIVLVCGHYEGVDERVRELDIDEEISIGDYVLSNGTLAAMVLVDTVARLVPGVLGDERSAVEDSFYNGLLDYPQYTRPRSFEGLDVPEVLLSGNHREIALWRRRESLRRTHARRPDLLEKTQLSERDKKLLKAILRKE
jgi:tRNA (guanine37-N1)-methyltransferase